MPPYFIERVKGTWSGLGWFPRLRRRAVKRRAPHIVMKRAKMAACAHRTIVFTLAKTLVYFNQPGVRDDITVGRIGVIANRPYKQIIDLFNQFLRPAYVDVRGQDSACHVQWTKFCCDFTQRSGEVENPSSWSEIQDENTYT